MPDSFVSNSIKGKWLLDLCRQHVQKYVFNSDELDSLVGQTDKLDTTLKQTRWQCRVEGCSNSYVYHSARVRHEIAKHGLSFDNTCNEDERDHFGYYFCRKRCGQVFRTKATRNRHEKKEHPGETFNETESQHQDPDQDHIFNYHSAKLSFGLILFEFNATIKEGDGERLFDLYKLVLLLYKSNGHFKYAYVVLLHLVRCIAILSESQALSCKWNRFYNKNGGKGKNISLDLKNEQQNRIMKTMWRALGANLDESNADRVAKSLEIVELICESVDKDCHYKERSTYRANVKEEESVHQIVTDLTAKFVFKKTQGRIGYESFPIFKKSLLEGLDYRDLHRWFKEHIMLWGSIHEK